MVALLGQEPPPGRELPCLGDYLRDLAAKTGLDFFCHQGPRREYAKPPTAPDNPRVRFQSMDEVATWADRGPRDSGRHGGRIKI